MFITRLVNPLFLLIFDAMILSSVSLEFIMLSHLYTVHRSGLAPIALGPGRPDHPRARDRARGCVALALFGRAKGQHRWPVACRVSL